MELSKQVDEIGLPETVCFLFDETGAFIDGYYIVGLLAEAFCQKEQAAKIVHAPRLTWNTLDICAQYGAQAIQSKTGHAFIKERMRKEDAVYGGEFLYWYWLCGACLNALVLI